jgi:hypothetical protein
MVTAQTCKICVEGEGWMLGEIWRVRVMVVVGTIYDLSHVQPAKFIINHGFTYNHGVFLH